MVTPGRETRERDADLVGLFSLYQAVNGSQMWQQERSARAALGYAEPRRKWSSTARTLGIRSAATRIACRSSSDPTSPHR
jgi:hypothetical protein